ncbi:MAG: porin family protein [Bacteroidetes bacterium]|nr:porin family protein [Bacteroidota bacterium]
MKTRINPMICVIVAIILSCSLSSYGQFALGIRIGYNANKLTTYLDSVKSQFKSGLHFGIWTHIGKRFYFAPELRYSLSGGVFSSESGVSAADWKQRITVGTIDVPLLLGFKIIHSKVITWRFELGPEASFVVNEKVEDMNAVLGPITTGDINSANWFIMAGTGIDFLFMNFDIRYQYGLNSMIRDVTVNNQSFSVDTKNSLIAVSLGFKILGKK